MCVVAVNFQWQDLWPLPKARSGWVRSQPPCAFCWGHRGHPALPRQAATVTRESFIVLREAAEASTNVAHGFLCFFLDHTHLRQLPRIFNCAF